MNKDNERRWWQLLLIIHLICYEVFFIIALSNFNYVWYTSQNNFIILLLWTPLLMLHVGATYYQRGRGDISRLEREAYREGYADAMHQLEARGEPIKRLGLDDEGELVEFREKEKRHH
jgi:hypothetical protein